MMVNVDDPSRLRERLDNQLRKLRRAAGAKKSDEQGPAPVSKEEEEEIKRFLNHLRANSNNKSQSNANHIKNLRLTSQRADMSLVNMGKEDIDFFTTELQDKYGCSKDTVNNYKAAWKPFYRFLGKEWASEIEFYKIDDHGRVDKRKVYSDEEIDAMLEEADSRETAAIAIMADTGSRIGAVCSLYNGDRDLSGKMGILILNDKAPTKGAEGNVPLTWSRPYIKNYLQNDHPQPNNDDVALIHKKERYNEGDTAIKPKYLACRIKKIMDSVGISKERQECHNFRHTAVTKWLRMGISKDVIQHRTKWADMSMLDNYSHLVEEDKNLMTAEEFGLVDPKNTQGKSDPQDALGECPVCATTLRSGVRYCPGCGNPITAEAAHKASPSNIQDPETTGEELTKFREVREELSPAAALEQLLKKNPELLEEIDLPGLVESRDG